jgi:Flp pilus assembly pilin Flp
MKISVAHNLTRGQTSLEYLLILAVVAVIVIASFSPGSLVQQVHDSAQSYYNTVTTILMGANPKPINGGWCPVTCPSGSVGPAVMYKACECPVPAFGGAYCSGNGVVNCGTSSSCILGCGTVSNCYSPDCSGVCGGNAYKDSNGNCCTPTTCAALGNPCGSQSDGCGGTLNCGTCPSSPPCTPGPYRTCPCTPGPYGTCE